MMSSKFGAKDLPQQVNSTDIPSVRLISNTGVFKMLKKFYEDSANVILVMAQAANTTTMWHIMIADSFQAAHSARPAGAKSTENQETKTATTRHSCMATHAKRGSHQPSSLIACAASQRVCWGSP